jgi:glycosyltransferase 2 family protein
VSSRLSQGIALAVGLGVGAALLAWSFQGTDLASVVALLRAGHWGAPALFVVLGTGVFVASKAIRWRWLLGGGAAPSAAVLVRPVLAGLALNALVPHAGEFVRAFALQRQHGYVASAVLASIVAERVFDLFAVLLLAAGALWWVPLPTAVGAAVRTLGAVALVGSLGIVAVLAWPAPFQSLARALAARLPQRLGDALLREVEAALAGFAPVRSLPVSLRVLALSLLQWLAIAACAAGSARVVGDAIGLGHAILVVVGIVVAFLLPNAPGYAGSAQWAFRVSLGAAGIAPDHALAASVVYQLLMIVPVVVAGLATVRGALSNSPVRQ